MHNGMQARNEQAAMYAPSDQRVQHEWEHIDRSDKYAEIAMRLVSYHRSRSTHTMPEHDIIRALTER